VLAILGVGAASVTCRPENRSRRPAPPRLGCNGAELAHRAARPRRGEIDHLLLGPLGLFAIEVKSINATVHIDGDRWQAEVERLIRRDHDFHERRRR